MEADNPHPSLSGSLPRPLPTILHHSIMYAPKCLVLVSRQDYIETFRVRLFFVYANHNPLSYYCFLFYNVLPIFLSELPWYHLYSVC